ncbi:translation elongation factor Ts [Aciditerrimonas ferrireducens]|uniref:translation elongation factor Ts n=1 Tax=Aciditerrimonas ferrireducens TaxID=667306 RepID=UPI002003F7BF|nr:translation elongation factor Ts [Aciditerrimonas ferrireducens]MCK4177742.1 translation elongation factor Ts [Aciditerrimonas ferrireducens]
MATISAKDVQTLRQQTGAGMMDCKRALEEADGDLEAARKLLRERGLAGAAKRADREAAQGAVGLAVLPGAAAIVELRCETDFVAKAESFVALVDELARLVAEKGEDAASARQEAVDDLRTTLKENISVGRVVRFVPAEGSVLGSYLHQQAGRGVNAVLVEVKGGSPQVLRPEDLPEAEVAEERATVERMARNEGKPEAALPKIVEGRMQAFYKERCLLEQPFVKDEKRSVGQVLGGADVLRFAQVVVGG